MPVNDFFSILPALVFALFGCALLLMRFESSRVYVVFLTIGEVLAAIGLWRHSDFLGLIIRHNLLLVFIVLYSVGHALLCPIYEKTY